MYWAHISALIFFKPIIMTNRKFSLLFTMLVSILLFINCKDNTTTTQDKILDTTNETGHSHSHDSDSDHSHSHQEEMPLKSQHANDNTHIDEGNHHHDHESDQTTLEDEGVLIDSESIYKYGDLFKTINGANANGDIVPFPSNIPKSKLLAFIDFVPDNLKEYDNSLEHQNTLKSLDSFAQKNSNYEVIVLHFGIDSEDLKNDINKKFLRHIKSKYVDNLIIDPTSYYDSLEVNVGPLYFRLDKNNTVQNIFAGSHTANELL